MKERIRKIFYYWAPYVAYSLLVFDFALTAHIGSVLLSKRGLLFIGILLLAIALLGVHLYSCFRAATSAKRKEARFTLLFSTVIYLLFLCSVEAFLPSSDRDFTKTQKTLQALLRRRNQTRETPFRNITLRSTYNELGWADTPRDYTPGQDQIVLIGDSFLEVRSSKNLATITEQRLKSMGSPQEVINLSRSDIGVDQYRYIFREFALELRPSHIFLFLYEGNDLTSYTYTPYQHPPFSIPKKALVFLKKLSLPPDTQAALIRLKRKHKIFTTKTELFRELQDMELNSQQKNLIYLACYGYSRADQDDAPAFPKTSALLTKLTGRALDYVRTYWHPHSSQSHRPTVLSLYPHYVEIFNLPENERLEAIAKLISQKYLFSNEYYPCLNLLSNQQEEFISTLLAEVDMPFYFFQAVEEALQGTVLPGRKPSPEHVIEQITDEYIKLFDEMFKTAASKGISMTIVLIPEASYADEEFYDFWLPMMDFQKNFAEHHGLYLSLKRKLSHKIPVLDLGEFASRFKDSYWKFDGHWNEQGNQEVSKILTTYLLQNNIGGDSDLVLDEIEISLYREGD